MKVRCAIYTRKSSEEGLEQDFNSLDAQREACEAYVMSQASHGWSLIRDAYDDGGLSGGTLNRPGLQRLLADIAAGRIDIVVVYKVDRLTRSLLDFAKLVEAFDHAGTSFVSVTQSFNTTTSMGRLTLNMLLSFAQFEREVTAERIRDKIAASKAKGMWMGGTPPLGYRPDGRSLAIVEDHARLVRDLFTRYLTSGNVRLLADDLVRDGLMVPMRTCLSGRTVGGIPFHPGQLYKLLANPIYIGLIPHRGKTYKGNHPAIIDNYIWDQVQAMLAANRQGIQQGATARVPSLLAGLLVDEIGEPLVSSHACKGHRRYRYYISRSLSRSVRADGRKGMRLSALELEKTIAHAIAARFDDPLELIRTTSLTLDPDAMVGLAAAAADLAARVRRRERLLLRRMIVQIVIEPTSIRVVLDTTEVATALGLSLPPSAPKNFTLTIDARIKRSGMAMRMVQSDGRPSTPAHPQPTVIRQLSKARAWWQELVTDYLTITQLARRHDVTASYATRLVRLNFLAPSIVEAALAGTLPPGVDATKLLTVGELPPSWLEQVKLLDIR